MLTNTIVSLTKSTTFIIGPIANIFGVIMDTIYNVFSSMGIVSLGFSIIVFTLIVRTLMLPLAFQQQKSMKEMQKIQPELKKLQSKYKDKKDQASQQKYQMEMNELYKEHGVNPFGGCLPLLVQMPIIFALFQVLRNIPSYITHVNALFKGIATQVMTIEGSGEIFTNWISENRYQVKEFDITNVNKVIDTMGQFSSDMWVTFQETFPSIRSIIEVNYAQISEIYTFLGINLADKPDLMSIGVLLPIMNVLIQILVMRTSTSSGAAQDNPTQKSMMYTMPLITGFFVIQMPAGLGLYWLVGSLYQLAQQFVINRHLHGNESK